MSNGNIEFLGRIDQQVKIRGFRIELGEIESRLSNYPSIKEAVVIAREDESGEKYLCAYIAVDTETGVSELREYLTKDLPDYMIPSYFVPLEKIPLTPNGKLDRKALPGPKVEASLQYAAPRDKVEEKLVAIWADMLRIDKSVIGIDDNFFVLGGHSLRATLMIGRIHKELDVKFPLLEVFKTPNIRSMAKYIKGAVKEEFISLEPLEQKEYYPVSSQQKRLFILQQRYLNLTAYSRPNLFLSPVELDKEKLQVTFRELIQRHESLRTSFDMINGEPVQRIHTQASFAIEYYDGAFTQETIANFVRPFDLSQAPLFRVRIMKPGNGKNILLVDIHHIISDGVSDAILISDFMALFEGKQLPALKFQYKDFSQWQARLLESGEMKKQEKYWLETFTGEMPQLAIPRDYPDSLEQRFEGSGIYVELDDKTTGFLKELAMREGTTLFMILFAVYNVLLAKLGGQEDIVVGTGVAGRRHVDFENVIGMFVNTLALRNYPAAEKTFKDFLFEVNQRTLLAFENQDYVFEDLVEKVVTKSDPGRNPIFDTVFVMQNMASESETAAAGNTAQPELLLKRQEFDAKISIFDISVFCEEIGGKLGIKVSYSTGVFKQETIEKYFGYYKDILAYVIENKELIFKLKDIRLASGLKVIESKLIKNETGDFGF
ncbi:MAG: condensation domain-containing protein [Candidatus Aminicenantes bacterium]|nr:condensation domain-containing protein [Candidatus Aminicenantes bacterium]